MGFTSRGCWDEYQDPSLKTELSPSDWSMHTSWIFSWRHIDPNSRVQNFSRVQPGSTALLKIELRPAWVMVCSQISLEVQQFMSFPTVAQKFELYVHVTFQKRKEFRPGDRWRGILTFHENLRCNRRRYNEEYLYSLFQADFFAALQAMFPRHHTCLSF